MDETRLRVFARMFPAIGAVSILLVGGMGFFAAGMSAGILSEQELGWGRYVLYGVSALMLVLIPPLQRAIDALPVAAQAPDATVAAYGRLCALSLALVEFPVMLGLMLGIFSGSAVDTYVGAGLSLVLLAIHFPRLDRWLLRRG